MNLISTSCSGTESGEQNAGFSAGPPMRKGVLMPGEPNALTRFLLPHFLLYFVPLPMYRLLTPIVCRSHPFLQLQTLALLPVPALAATQALTEIAPSKMRQKNVVNRVRICLSAGPRSQIDRSRP
jgi:hypothetical protein